MTISVNLIPILNDNYAYLLQGGGQVAVVDPGEAEPIIDYLETHDLRLDVILNTHHHYDHIDGNAELIQKYGATLIAPAIEPRIENADIRVGEGDEFELCGEMFQVIETPAHTNGHICFYAPTSGIVFTGDTLFALGCGRLFEGSAEELFAAFEKLRALPDDTRVYCGHEYTLGNAEFCAAQAPDNQAIQARLKDVKAIRERGEPTLPTTIGLEKQTNLFFMAENAEELARLRKLKDHS